MVYRLSGARLTQMETKPVGLLNVLMERESVEWLLERMQLAADTSLTTPHASALHAEAALIAALASASHNPHIHFGQSLGLEPASCVPSEDGLTAASDAEAAESLSAETAQN